MVRHFRVPAFLEEMLHSFIMKIIPPLHSLAVVKQPFRSTSDTGDILTISDDGSATVAIKRWIPPWAKSPTWTIQTAYAERMLRFALKVGFDFSLGRFLDPAKDVWAPVLLLHLKIGGQTLSYSDVLEDWDDISEFFRKYPGVDILVTGTRIVRRDGAKAIDEASRGKL